jgi:hypothetical protein
MWEYKGTVQQQFIVFEKAHNSMRTEVLYNVLLEFGMPMKLVRLIKMDGFPVQNGLKKGDALLPLPLNFDLEYTTREVKEYREELILNGRHQFLVLLTILIYWVKT